MDTLLGVPPLSFPKDLRKAREKVWGTSAFPLDLNASFRTADGAIGIDLAVIAPPNAAQEPVRQRTPAKVHVASRKGHIRVDVVSPS